MSDWTDLVASHAGLELWWRLGDGSGTTAADSSGNARHGTYRGTPAWEAGTIRDDADLAFTASGDDDVVLADAAWMDTVFTGTYTEFCWFRTPSTAGVGRRLFGRFHSPTIDDDQGAHGMVLFGDGQPFFYSGSDADANALLGPLGYDDDDWHLIAVERDASGSPVTLAMWLDGRPAASRSEVVAPVAHGNPLTVASHGTGWFNYDGTQNWDGGVDEFLLFSRMFTDAEHRQLFCAGHRCGGWRVGSVPIGVG